MTRLSIAFGLTGVTALAALTLVGHIRVPNPEAGISQVTERGPRVPVVVELFTSEGCSSCPPADTALASLQNDQPVPGAQIIALSEHVDYWNYIGWKDPYSSEAYSERQRSYARSLRIESIYTPQIVVDGRAELLGSDRNLAQAAVDRARRAAHLDVQLLRVSGSSGRSGIQITVESTSSLPDNDTAEVMLAITENNLRSKVLRGENAGRSLTHAAVVRRLGIVGALTAGRPFKIVAPIQTEILWKAADLNAVAFVQMRSSRRVIGAATLALRSSAPN